MTGTEMAKYTSPELSELLNSSLTLREEHRRRVFENRVLRGIFGPQMDELIGGWRKLHDGEMGRACSAHGGKEECI
jgi:hypothetical protein